MDVWGLASALSDAVKKSTNDITETFRNTEWKNEFADMRKEIEEDTSELTASAKTLTDEIGTRTAKVVQQSGVRGGEIVQPALLRETHSKVQEMGRKIFHGTSETYDKLSKAFQKELGIGSVKEASSSQKKTRGYAFSRLDLEKKALQNSASTFTDDPEDMEAYGRWKQAEFSREDKSADTLLEESPALRDMHSRLVPGDVSEEDFWPRYLFKLHIVEDRCTLIAKAAERTENESGDFAWEDDAEEDPSLVVKKEYGEEECKEEEEEEEKEKAAQEQMEEKEGKIECTMEPDAPCQDDAITGEEQPSPSSLADEDSWTDMGSNDAKAMGAKLDSGSTDDIDIIDDDDVANWE